VSDEKTFRTSAFHTNGGGGYLYRYFVMSPAYQKPGYQIKEHEKGVYCGATIRIADGLSEKDALGKLAQLERENAAAHEKVTGKELDDLGPDYHQAALFIDKNDAATADKVHELLRQKRPGPGFGPR
jgi:hypothetical protein